MTDAELSAIAFAATAGGSVHIDGAVLRALVDELIANRKALRECGEKLASRDAKIIELREIIHAGAAPGGNDHARKSGTQKGKRKPGRTT